MDAMEFCKQLDRICKSHFSCESCPLGDGKCSIRYIGRNGESVVKIVEEWAKDHPVKTRQSEFLKMFPNAQMVGIERTFCVAHFDITKKCKGTNPSEEQCIACRYRFWNEEVTDND